MSEKVKAADPLRDSSAGVIIPQQNWADYDESVPPITATSTGASSQAASEAELLSAIDSLSVSEKKTPAKEKPAFGGLHPKDVTAELVVIAGGEGARIINSFEELKLRSELLDGIVGMNFNTPSKIQSMALPLILGVDGPRQSFIGQAHSGAGKTAAFVLGMLSAVDENDAATQAICIAPTRELAKQIYQDAVIPMSKFIPKLTHLLVVPEEKFPRKITSHVVVGTPGKIFDLVSKKRSINLKKCKVFVLDEADNVMVDMADITEKVRFRCAPDCQTLLFSATFPETVSDFTLKLTGKPYTQVLVKRELLTVEDITQFYVVSKDNEEKFSVICKLYDALSLGQSIIFAQTKETARELARRMTALGHAVSLLHGKPMQVAERDRVMKAFRDGTSTVLVTTNVLSRGIDVPAVTMVVNFDMPVDQSGRADGDTYLHRIGRTGRMGNKGVAVSFVCGEDSMRVLAAIQKEFPRGNIGELKNDDKLEDTLEKLVVHLQEENKNARK